MSGEATASLRLDLLTAEPLLRLMVAQRGYESPDIPLAEGWAAFKVFASAAAAVPDAGSTFQIANADAGPDDVEIFFGRQLSDVLGDRSWAETRIVGLSFVLSGVGPVEEEEVWSADFGSLADFFRHVEDSDGFRASLAAESHYGVFHVEEGE